MSDLAEELEACKAVSVALQKRIKNLEEWNKEMYENHKAAVKILEDWKQSIKDAD